MGLYKFIWLPSTKKDIKRIDKQYVGNILQEIQVLKDSPYPLGCRKLSTSNQTYRIRVGDYRIIYQVNEDQKIVCIEKIGHRKEVYRNL